MCYVAKKETHVSVALSSVEVDINSLIVPQVAFTGQVSANINDILIFT